MGAFQQLERDCKHVNGMGGWGQGTHGVGDAVSEAGELHTAAALSRSPLGEERVDEVGRRGLRIGGVVVQRDVDELGSRLGHGEQELWGGVVYAAAWCTREGGCLHDVEIARGWMSG